MIRRRSVVLLGATLGPALAFSVPMGSSAQAANSYSCQAVASPAAATKSVSTCQFTTDDPLKAAAQGVTSADSGSFTVTTKQKKCFIVSVSTTGGNNVQSTKWTSSGAQATSLAFSNHCTYTLTVHPDGTGPVTAGQTNDASSSS